MRTAPQLLATGPGALQGAAAVSAAGLGALQGVVAVSAAGRGTLQGVATVSGARLGAGKSRLRSPRSALLSATLNYGTARDQLLEEVDREKL